MKPCTVPAFIRLLAQALPRNTHGAPRRTRSSFATIVVSAVVALGVLGPAALPASAAFQYQNDEQGANDQPGQKDLTRHGIDSSGLPSSVGVTWNWDVTSLSGGNTGDACALFDTDTDARVNFAVCVTIEGNPAVQSSLSPRLYTCGNDKVDRCTQPVGQITSFSTTCSVAQTATDPFAADAAYPADTTALCNVQLADVGGTDAKLIDTCSYPSEIPNSDPSDCVLIPRDGFLKIVKNATPDDPTVPFNFYLDGGASSVFTSMGSGTSNVIAVRTDNGPHSLSETMPSNWKQDSATCDDGSAVGSINVSSDETVTCTFNNSLALGTLIVKKHVVSDNGGSLTASDFNLHVKSGGSDVSGSPASGSESGTSYSLNGGSYSVSEDAAPSGYTQTGFSGDCDSSGNVTVVAGESKTCTITNDDVAPVLHLRKLVTNDNGGTASITDWTLHADGAGSNDLSGETPVDSGAALKADTFTLSESGGPSGYSPSDWSCSGGTQGTGADKDKIAVAIGGEATCTITNDDVAPVLHLRKLVTNDNGGTASITDWTLHADGAGSNDLSGETPVDSGAALKADTFTLSESGGPSGYSPSDWSCSGGTQGTGADKDKIAVAIGGEATCTITNDDVAPVLHLRKLVTNDNGGTASITDWTLHADGAGSNDLSGETPVDSGAALKADTFTLSESGGPSGYSPSDWSCSGGTQGTGADKDKIAVAIGGEATCTITNDDVAPVLHLRKLVTNDNGGTASITDWTLHADGAGSNDLSGETPVDSGAALKADTFTLSESGGPSGYSPSDWSCSGGTQGTGADKDKIAVAIGGEATCTITNDDVAPKLTVVKHVVNDNGGTATADLFSMHIENGGSDVSGKSPFAGSESGTQRTVDAGSYNVSETGGPSGYASSVSGDCSSSGDVSLSVGQTKTCTITNDDVAPKLTVIKHVVNDNGGTATADLFSMHIENGGSDVSGKSPFAGSESGTQRTVDAGSYNVSETGGPSGYASSVSGDCSSSGDVSLSVGQTKTCTITNDDVAPVLHLRKLVTNDNGGTASITDWTLHADGAGSNDLSGETPVDSGAALKADTFTLSESGGPSGYSPSDWSCSGGTQGTGADKDKIAVAIGGEATCTITNDDVAPKLTVVKHVVNDNGGTATADLFSMHIENGGSDVSGKSPFAGSESGTQRTVDAGSYNVSETGGPSGYASSVSGDCSSSGDVSLSVGQTKTCTITNDDVAPKLTVIKHVVNDNGGTATADLFSMHIENGGSDVSGKSPFAGSESGTQRTVDAGSYNVSETGGPSGYASSVSGDCSSSGDVSLSVGQTKTCTITNDDIAPTLTVIKHVKNDNGGTATASQFTMHVKQGGTDVSGKSPFAGDESGTNRSLSAGSFNVSETGGPAGYASSISGDCATNGDVTLALAQNKTCTITNDDVAPKLTVIKHVVNDNGGTATANLFSMHIKQGGTDLSGKSPFAGSESGTQRTVDAGSYVVSESDGPTGYAASISGACSANGAVTLAPGDVKTCTITNNDFAITTSLTSAVGTTGAKITVAQGDTVSDVATLAGAPANAGGSVSYKVFTNSSCTTLLQAAGTGTVGAGNVAAASDQVTFNQTGTYYWMAYYSGNGSVDTQKSKCGDEIVTVVTPATGLTPGYWKTHKAETTRLLPVSLGNYVVDTFTKASDVFDNMNCSSSSDNGAIGCLAGHLLATKLNLKNLSSPCILPVVTKTDAFLKAQSVTYAGITTTGINYTGPAANYTLTSAQRNLAIALKSAMDKYNNGGGC